MVEAANKGGEIDEGLGDSCDHRRLASKARREPGRLGFTRFAILVLGDYEVVWCGWCGKLSVGLVLDWL